MIRIVLTALLLMVSVSMAQKADPEKILSEVKAKFSQVRDYSVDVHIKVDVDFIKVPEMDAKVYFKQPNKMKLDAKGFAMLPKQAFSFSPSKFLEGSYNAVYSGTEKIDNKTMSVIKVIPLSDSSEFVLSTLWIDTDKDVIRKVESVVKRGGNFSFTIKYDEKTNYPLPASINFFLDASKMRLPSREESSDNNGKQQKKPAGGNILITYRNYSVNKGIPDSIFKEKKQK